MSESAKVMQGRLGWEVGDVSMASVSELAPHPKNTEIYGETEPGEQFVQSVREKGVLEPLVIKGDKTILSGHRRWTAAREVGVGQVPVRIAEFDSELGEREALIEFNRQREKTPGQLTNEFEEILEIEQQRAKERQAESGSKNLPTTDDSISSGNVSETNGEAREKAAEKVDAGVSGRTLEKGLNVKREAEDGDETAQEEWEKLQEGETSFTKAEETVKEGQSDSPASDGQVADSESGGDVGLFTSQETDEWSSPREVVEPIAESIGGFALDPCSGAEQSPFADETYTEDDDGLSQPWHGDVWVNPPYSDMSTWTEKAVAESERGDVKRVVYLCKGDSSTQWWQSAIEQATAVCAIDGRLSFGDGGNSAPFASHIFVFGALSDGLTDALRDQGALLAEVGGDDGE